MGGLAFLTGDYASGAGLGIDPAAAEVIMKTIGALTPDSPNVQQIQGLIEGTATLWGGG
jgi:hypothetical protein